jgi:hypothetical protein
VADRFGSLSVTVAAASGDWLPESRIMNSMLFCPKTQKQSNIKAIVKTALIN